VRATATVATTPTRQTTFEQTRVIVRVQLCVDERYTNSAEFGTATDIGAMSLADIDQSQCRVARPGEVRVKLASNYPNYLPRISETGTTAANGDITWIVPVVRDERIATLHLEGTIPGPDASLRLYAGRVIVIPLTVVVPAGEIAGVAPESAAASALPSGPATGAWLAIRGGIVLLMGLVMGFRLSRRTIR
jgi:hypothetical protein